MERSRLLATEKNLLKIKVVLINTVVIRACTKQRANTQWNFYKLTNFTVFSALLKEVPMGCIDAVLPKPLAEIHRIYSLAYEDNTTRPYNDNLRLFRAFALHLHGNEGLEEESSKMFTLSKRKWRN